MSVHEVAVRADCREPLQWRPEAATCTGCGSECEIDGGVPLLLTPLPDAHKDVQRAFLDAAVFPGFEITRRRGAPPLYGWMLEEKFRRSVDHLVNVIDGASVLWVRRRAGQLPAAGCTGSPAGAPECADVQLVLQRRVSSNANLPSKIATYLASGRPIIASIDPEAPAARLLDESGGAILVPPEDPERLANAMVLLRSDTDLREALGGLAFAVAHLDRECVLEKLEQVVDP